MKAIAYGFTNKFEKVFPIVFVVVCGGTSNE